MPRTCTICEHPHRGEIDRALVGDSSNLSVSSLFGVSESAVRRHKANHLPAKLAKAREAQEMEEADGLFQDIEEAKRDIRRLKEQAERDGDLRTALMGCDKALKALDLQMKAEALVEAHRIAIAERAPAEFRVVYVDEDGNELPVPPSFEHLSEEHQNYITLAHRVLAKMGPGDHATRMRNLEEFLDSASSSPTEEIAQLKPNGAGTLRGLPPGGR